jgi:hypothetical protein
VTESVIHLVTLNTLLFSLQKNMSKLLPMNGRDTNKNQQKLIFITKNTVRRAAQRPLVSPVWARLCLWSFMKWWFGNRLERPRIYLQIQCQNTVQLIWNSFEHWVKNHLYFCMSWRNNISWYYLHENWAYSTLPEDNYGPIPFIYHDHFVGITDEYVGLLTKVPARPQFLLYNCQWT